MSAAMLAGPARAEAVAALANMTVSALAADRRAVCDFQPPIDVAMTV
jgi:hypothetical protein